MAHLTPLVFTALVFAVALVAGLIGSLVGIGGGIIIVPALTLIFGLNIRYAIGASIVSVIATSSGAAAGYVREHMTNLRVAMLLEIGTTTGALTGAFLAGIIHPRALYIIFGILMGYSALQMYIKRHATQTAVPPDKWSDKLRLHDKYFDQAINQTIPYRVTRAKTGLFLMYIAGVVSGLLGIGSGALKVAAMDLAMRLPIKVSTATSNFMIGVTAAASAGVYFARGDINPFVAAPVATGVLIGATVGSTMLSRLQNNFIRTLFVIVLIWISVEMLLKGIRGT